MLQRAQGRRTVPQIFIDGVHVGGCDDLYALESAGSWRGCSMEQKVKVALLQLTSGPDIAENVTTVEAMVRDAAGQGPGLS